MSLRHSSVLGSRPFPGAKPILCYVTDRRQLEGAREEDLMEPLLRKIAAAAAGVDWIQLREKDLSGRHCAGLTREALRRVSRQTSHASSPARVLVNDRVDVAIAEGACGVHLGEDSLPVEEAKRLLTASRAAETLPKDFLLGVSCHSLASAQCAASAGADYLFFGPVFDTPSKAPYGAPQGLDRLAAICKSVAIPVLAIGGVTLSNVSSCFSAGASGIAAIRLFQDSADPAAVARAIRGETL